MPLKKLFVVFFIFVAKFCLTACFPMGLPEHFSPYEGPQVGRAALKRLPELRQPLCVIALPERSSFSVDAPRETLGNQYFLALFPLTRLYFQRTSQSLLVETTADALRDIGCSVIFSSADGLPHVTELFRPLAIIRPNLDAPSVNAYDALFFRILSLDAQLSIDYLSVEDPSLLVSRHRVNVSDSEFKRYGHAPSLSRMFTTALRKEILEEFRKGVKRGDFRRKAAVAKTPNPKPNSINKAETKTLLLVSAPQMLKAPPPRTGQLLAASYGFNSVPAYGIGTLRRIIHRGILQGLEELGHSVVGLSSDHETIPGLSASADRSAWLITPKVQAITFSLKDAAATPDALGLSVEFVVSDLSVGKPRKLFEMRCVLSKEPPPVDGYWVAALEQASLTLAKTLLTQKDLTVCRNLR